MSGKILLIRPPFFTPLTPPLGIGILKSFLTENGYDATCVDLNIDSELWGMHHKYFAALRNGVDLPENEGYSTLWWILHAHTLSYINGADRIKIRRVLEQVIPKYGLTCSQTTIESLLPIVESFYERLSKMVDDLDFSNVNYVGISSYTTSLASSLFVLRTIKQSHPTITTIMGGGLFADDLAIKSENLSILINEYPFVDHVVLGEGELLLLKLLNGELNHKKVISLDDLDRSSFSIGKVPIPDFSDFNLDAYHHLTIEGARSCPFQCSFCSETIQWGTYRKKSNQAFVEQVLELSRCYNKKSFFMGDSLMNPYLDGFANGLLERNADVLYDGYLRADKPVTMKHRVETWARSGMYRVRIGVESAAPNVLEIMNKKITPQAIGKVLKTLSSCGVRTTTYWVVGHPGETEQDFEETLDFIRDHHRYIYELEAHPYYYYPYGQIDSRLYQCTPLYSEEVTEAMRFKVWEIVDANPDRMIRYERLHRICKLAGELGIPNIYNLEDLYAAEERWRSLHPLAYEVYPDEKFNRVQPRPLHLNVEHQLPSNSTEPIVHHCQFTILDEYDPTNFRKAVLEMIRHNEPLLMDWEVDGLTISPFEESRFDSVIQTHGLDSDLLNQIQWQMKPTAGHSIRVLVCTFDDRTIVNLFLHSSIGDTHTVQLLVNDLYRLYHQCTHNKPISLRTQEETFSQMVHTEKVSMQTNTRVFSSLQETSVMNIPLSSDLHKSICTGQLNSPQWSLEHLFLSAILHSLHAHQLLKEANIRYAFNPRAFDNSFEYATGPIVQLLQQPGEMLSTHQQRFVDSIEWLMNPLANHEISVSFEDSDSRLSIFVNTQYATQPIWLSNDHWIMDGFWQVSSSMMNDCDLEIRPVVNPEGVSIQIVQDAKSNRSNLIGNWIETLSSDVEDYFKRVIKFQHWKTHWNDELKLLQKGSLPEQPSPVSIADDRWITVSLDANPTVNEHITTPQERQAIAIAAFSVLISRLDELEVTSIRLEWEECNRFCSLPCMFMPHWNQTATGFVHHVNEKVLALATDRPLVLDAYHSVQQSEGGTNFEILDAIRWIEDSHSIENVDTHMGPKRMLLLLDSRTSAVPHSLIVNSAMISKEDAYHLAQCLDQIQSQLILKPDLWLRNIQWNEQQVESTTMNQFAEDAFQF